MRWRFRHVFLVGGSAAVIGALLYTDPDNGISTGMLMLGLVTPLIAVLFAHLARKALHDYPEADASALFRKAKESPIGAGLALVALAIVLSALLGLFGRSANAQPHPRAVALAPLVNAEIGANWPELEPRAYVFALISHESCVTYRHSRCWSPTSRLRARWRPKGATGVPGCAWLRSATLVGPRRGPVPEIAATAVRRPQPL